MSKQKDVDQKSNSSQVDLLVRKLPWQCPDHPESEIKQTWDRTRYVFNGYPSGVGIDSNYKYECNECGRELAAP